ncbi:MAG: 3-oxoacyl-ACP synthase [Flavobacteriaceae bacterium]|nr:3-oxoacyl-ACP synthase [Flavobacteriaceae bacterium]OUV87460.1 MAG: 3-oxoacyl-ACP synthase [Flavobacteriaceae bacterium TMED145]
MNIKITGTGSYIPEIIQDNYKFLDRNFFDNEGNRIETKNEEIIEKFQKITGIRERRYAKDELNTSDIAYLAAKEAIINSKVDPEKIDYIILAHNFGNANNDSTQVDVFPSLAVRVKNLLKIKNPKCVAYDILFGCPGWLEGIIQGYGFIKAGMAERCLVIGADTLSRVVDVNDRDSMIFADGAGATIIEKTEEKGGILSHNTASYTDDEVFYLFYGKSYNPQADEKTKYIKMRGRKVYEFALTNVPSAMKECLDLANTDISEIKKILIHQANAKMDDAIVKRLYKLFNEESPEEIMPLTVDRFGNSSVATVPTMFDLIVRNKLGDHKIEKGDKIIFASVGAGMHINAMVYQY